MKRRRLVELGGGVRVETRLRESWRRLWVEEVRGGGGVRVEEVIRLEQVEERVVIEEIRERGWKPLVNPIDSRCCLLLCSQCR